jgi:hypothetical protein
MLEQGRDCAKLDFYFILLFSFEEFVYLERGQRSQKLSKKV